MPTSAFWEKSLFFIYFTNKLESIEACFRFYRLVVSVANYIFTQFISERMIIEVSLFGFLSSFFTFLFWALFVSILISYVQMARDSTIKETNPYTRVCLDWKRLVLNDRWELVKIFYCLLWNDAVRSSRLTSEIYTMTDTEL